MSINGIMNIATSGLSTAQNALKVTSDNISNVNTPGYIRKVANQQTVVYGGQGAGVTSGPTTLAADRFLEQATYKAQSASSAAQASYDLVDQIQTQFGDITDTNNLFNQMNSAMSSLASVAESPNSSAGRQEVISNLSGFLAEGQRISEKIQQVRTDADTRIDTDLKSVNDLLKNISTLNSTISSAKIQGQDVTGSQTQQTQYLDQLSKLMDIKVSQNDNGGITVRTSSGLMLAGDGAATLSYTPTASVDSSTVFNPITITTPAGEKRDLADNLASGEIKGLLDVRDKQSVAVNDQLNQYMSSFTEQLNAAHNAASAVPAPATLTGKNTSATQDEMLNGMTGTTNLVTVDTSGNIVHQMAVDFSAGTWSLDNGASTGTFSTSSFASDITSAFGGAATMSFNNGVMSLTAGSGATGVAIADSTTTPSSRFGQGFSQTFGLNDLVSSKLPTNTSTGLTLSSTSGFSTGSTPDSVSFAVKNSNGGTLSTVNVQIPSGDMNSVLTALNDTNTGLGRYGQFNLDSTTGALTFNGYGSPANSIGVSADSSSRYGYGVSFSQFFSLGGSAGNVAGGLAVSNAINANPANLSLATLNLTNTTTPALVAGDGSGGQAMSDIASKSVTIPRAGLNSGGSTTLTRYGSDLAGQVGNLAANAKTDQQSSDALLTEATNRRSSTEGVNLDEELVNLTTYQQAYSASGRLIQAAKDMFDVLLNMV
ncbi:flagellar hook-associated protein FlgK [Asticcacaulis solisilvae]|uniref:flagellar hook-associated protein FlgK n=1 Tax=Asticcacaulis solisilvae TaxID=1217274 RepID=UPI003FD7DA9E